MIRLGRTGRAGRLAVAHTRYSTTGATVPENSQPFVHRARRIALAHNGDLVNAAELRDRLGREGYAFGSTTDSEVILALLAGPGEDHGRAPGPAHNPAHGPAHGPENRHPAGTGPLVAAVTGPSVLRGGYAVVCAAGDRLMAFRDPHGLAPGGRGFAEGRAVVASETCTLDALGCSEQREVEPGELLILRHGRLAETTGVAEPAPRSFCVFQHLPDQAGLQDRRRQNPCDAGGVR